MIEFLLIMIIIILMGGGDFLDAIAKVVGGAFLLLIAVAIGWYLVANYFLEIVIGAALILTVLVLGVVILAQQPLPAKRASSGTHPGAGQCEPASDSPSPGDTASPLPPPPPGWNTEFFHARASANDIQHCLEEGEEVSAEDCCWRTPLHWVAMYGKTKQIELLGDWGGNVDAQDKYLKTPLHYAALHGHLGAVAKLVDGGANWHIRDDNKLVPLDYIERGGLSDNDKATARKLLADEPDKSETRLPASDSAA